MNWSKLNGSNPVIEGVINRWQNLVDNSYNEHSYHEFVKTHANLFLVDGINSYFAISKLKLGSQFELDFAIPEERHSNGLLWELIEIEKPSDAPYTKNGTPSAALTRATQQIRDWKQWLQTSRNEAQRLFSVWGVRTQKNPNFRFTIVIGTRENSDKWIEKRNQYAEENGIEVRSFDYLTDRLKKRVYLDQSYIGNGTWDKNNGDLLEQLANPFVEAFTDSEWKALLQEPCITAPHFTSNACKAIVTRWKQREDLIKAFQNHLVLSNNIGVSSENKQQ